MAILQSRMQTQQTDKKFGFSALDFSTFKFVYRPRHGIVHLILLKLTDHV